MRRLSLVQGENLSPVELARDRIYELVEAVTDALVGIRAGEAPLSGVFLESITECLTDAMTVLDEWASDTWWWEEVS